MGFVYDSSIERINITNVMFTEFNITDMDFMGYALSRDRANYHHLIIPRRNGGAKTVNNGAILNKDTSHPYLHVIEYIDYDIFYRITREMIDENKSRRIKPENIAKIDDLLRVFEREHSSESNCNGEQLIKEEYTKRLIK